jgi:hypothetical protein
MAVEICQARIAGNVTVLRMREEPAKEWVDVYSEDPQLWKRLE